MLVSTAASPAVAQLLTQLVEDSAVEDVVPADPDDPRGAALNAAQMPLVISSVAFGALCVLRVDGRGRRLLTWATFSWLAGATSTVVLQSWLEVLPSEWAAVAVVLTGFVAAVSGGVVAAGALLGRAGIALGAALMVLVGLPASGLASAPELLPSAWALIGQYLPPGAAGQVLRSVAFFGEAKVAASLTVVSAWVAGAAILMAVSPSRQRHAGERVPAGTMSRGRDDTVVAD